MSKRKHSRGKHTSPSRAKPKKGPAKRTFPANGEFNLSRRLDGEGLEAHLFPLIILIVVSVIAYANAWPDNLTLDDSIFSSGSPFSRFDLTDIGRIFGDDLWAAIGGGTGLYRPLLLISVAIDMQLFGDWVAGYHLVNIMLHTLVTIAVYGFVRHLLVVSGGERPASAYAAMLAALIFAVHPVHTEVVNSVFNRSDMLVTLGIVAGLWWFLTVLDKNPRKAWAVLSLVYLLILFCKESGIVLPAITVTVLWFTTPGNWRVRLRRCLPVFCLLIPLGIYLALRLHALEAPGQMEGVVAKTANQAGDKRILPYISSYFHWGKLAAAIKVWFDSLKLILWPHPLFAFHGVSQSNVWIALSAQVVLLAIALARFLQKRPGLLLGLLFFYLTILPSSRVIGRLPIVPLLAERFLYLPSVGLTIVLGFGLYWLLRRFAPRTVVTSIVIFMLVLTPLTWARNEQWSSTLLLVETDYQNGRHSGKTLTNLIGALQHEREFSKASALCDRHDDTFTQAWYLSTLCGQVYEYHKRYDKAEHAYRSALNRKEGMASAHLSLASMYLRLNRKNDAKEQFELAIMTEKKGFMKEFLSAEMLMQLYPSNRERLLEARTHLEKTVELQPQYQYGHQRLNELNDILSAADRRRN